MTEQEPNTEPQTEQESNEPVTIEPQTQTGGAGTPEDPAKVYKDMMAELEKQNTAMMEANRSLQEQIGQLIRNGASAGTPQPKQEPEPEPEPYVSLAELGSELGKRDYGSHNMEPSQD